MKFATTLVVLGLAGTAFADARTDYLLHCQGCHGAEGLATGDVPALVGFARFLRVDGGRAFLVRVPGVAQSALGDAALAAVLNWSLRRFGAPGPEGFDPYRAEEIGPLRRNPLIDVREVRVRLIAALEAKSAR